jgi:preprotein translocase SecE subunit
MSLLSYFKETQSELRHVAWPTRLQTIVYTVLVAAVSIFVALYLGFFDYLFTSTLARLAGVAPAATPAATEQTIDVGATSSPIGAPEFDIAPVTE